MPLNLVQEQRVALAARYRRQGMRISTRVFRDQGTWKLEFHVHAGVGRLPCQKWVVGQADIEDDVIRLRSEVTTLYQRLLGVSAACL